MNRNLSHSLPLLFLLSVCISSCRLPSSEEYYLWPDQVALDGSYRFHFNMSDSTATYDLSFYSRFDGDFHGSFPVGVVVRSPSGKKLEEQVYWDVTQPEVMYRSGIKPTELGEWEISLYVDELKGMRGMGLICKTVK